LNYLNEIIMFIGFVIIKDYVIHVHLGCNFVAIQGQHIDMASLNKVMSGRSITVTDSTHCINKAVIVSENNNIDHINEVLNSIDGNILLSCSVWTPRTCMSRKQKKASNISIN
jgi:hypothetical protein